MLFKKLKLYEEVIKIVSYKKIIVDWKLLCDILKLKVDNYIYLYFEIEIFVLDFIKR